MCIFAYIHSRMFFPMGFFTILTHESGKPLWNKGPPTPQGADAEAPAARGAVARAPARREAPRGAFGIQRWRG